MDIHSDQRMQGHYSSTKVWYRVSVLQCVVLLLSLPYFAHWIAWASQSWQRSHRCAEQVIFVERSRAKMAGCGHQGQCGHQRWCTQSCSLWGDLVGPKLFLYVALPLLGATISVPKAQMAVCGHEGQGGVVVPSPSVA